MTPPVSSADADPKTPEVGADLKPEPTAEEVAAAAAAEARSAVHETPEAYQVNLAAEAREALGLTDDDPLIAHLQKTAAEGKKPQGWMDDVLEAAHSLAEAGLFDAGLDPAKEATELGENAAGRRREVEVFAEALKSRNDGFDDAMFGEMMSLSPTAAGVRLIEYMRKMMTDTNNAPTIKGDTPNAADQAKEDAKALTADPRYGKDRRFTRDADQKWATAFGGRA